MTTKAEQILNYLLVEDNDHHANIVEECAKYGKLPTHIHRVKCGADCLKYLGGEDRFADRMLYPYPDAVLLDVRMPGTLDGLQTLEAIRSDPRHRWIPVTMLTTSDRDVDVRRAYDLGANGYIVKSSDTAGMVKQLYDMYCSHTSLAQLFERQQRRPLACESQPDASPTPPVEVEELLQANEDNAVSLLGSIWQNDRDEVLVLLERVERLDATRFASLVYRFCMEQQAPFAKGQHVGWAFLREIVMEKLPQYLPAEQMAGLLASISAVLKANPWVDRDTCEWRAWHGFSRAYVNQNLCSSIVPTE